MPKKLTIIPITSPDAQPEPVVEQAPEPSEPIQPEQPAEPPSTKAEPQTENEDIDTDEMEQFLKSEVKRREAENKLTEEKSVCPDCNKSMSSKSLKYSHAKNCKAKQPPAPEPPKPEPPKPEPTHEPTPQPKPKRKANPKPKVIKQQSYEADTEAPPIPKQKSFYEVQAPSPYEQESKQLNDRRERDLARLEQLRNLMSNAF